MARLAARLPENVEGEFYVDETCIDCATCRFVAPEVFRYEPRRGLSVVGRQPVSPSGEQRALMALVACPTASIGTVHHRDASPAVAAFPERLAEEVYYCGFASEDSYGASSYLVRRPDGNVLVDSPRATEPLLRAIEALGGVRWMFLTHRDDVADHRGFRERFSCERVLHARDVTPDTADVERRLEGTDPVRLADGLLAIPVPGHTAGSAALLVRDTFLFTGDHLMGDEGGGGLHASRGVCWYSWDEQVRSMERLLDHSFEWVLPGHGWRYRAPSAAVMREEVAAVVREMHGRSGA
jgi:glyoxylase-like metal-dependent hydrolase (beta-lactamase superfamily II)/ferredoxin